MKHTKFEKLVQVPGVLPKTWIVTDVSIPNDITIKKYLKLKTERDARSNKFQRWTGKDYLTSQ